MSDKQGHSMTLRTRNGVSKPPKKMEKLEQDKKLIVATKAMHDKAYEATHDKAHISSFTKINDSFFKRLEVAERKVDEVSSAIKMRFPILGGPLTSFIVTFAHPTYFTTYSIDANNRLTLTCAKISRDLLYKNKNEMAVNRLKISSFKLQLNDTIVDTVDTLEYDLQNQILTITTVFTSDDLYKSIIYFNILNGDAWKVPEYMKRTFKDMQLEPPAAAPLDLTMST